MRLLIPKALCVVLIFLATGARADYCATGKITGEQCSGFVFESCGFVNIDAQRGSDGVMSETQRCFSSVSNYKESKGQGRCWLNTKSNSPDFFTKNKDGDYESVDIGYLVFKCFKE